uniref:NADH dehydrogenase [ubiquinone] 1 alpha subcomplex assembly factor 4 n=1 Tax=Nyssomyia neivai TaxID=330878 RepID=A0A1L8DA92_9DIPT
MGQVGSMISRRANRWNAENRAHKIIGKDKPTPAPKYKSNLREIQEALKLTPDLVDKLNKKDAAHDDRLKQVYVTSESTIVQNDPETLNLDRPLPSDTKRVEAFEFGHKEPTNVRVGRVTLRQATQFLGDYQRNSTEWTVEKIAEHYKLPVSKVDAILTHFRPFQIYIPDPKRQDKVLQSSGQKAISSSEDKSKK